VLVVLDMSNSVVACLVGATTAVVGAGAGGVVAGGAGEVVTAVVAGAEEVVSAGATVVAAVVEQPARTTNKIATRERADNDQKRLVKLPENMIDSFVFSNIHYILSNSINAMHTNQATPFLKQVILRDGIQPHSKMAVWDS
jgi:hypothetical protein